MKTNRRDSRTLARLHRAGELTAVWLDIQNFAHPAQRLAYQEMLNAVRAGAERIDRLDAMLSEIVPEWTMAPMVAAFQACQGGITKTGDSRARKALIEAAWTYRHPAGIGRLHRDRQAHFPEQIRDIAWKAQARLCARYRRG